MMVLVRKVMAALGQKKQNNENSFGTRFITAVISKRFHIDGISIANDMKQPLKYKQCCAALVITKG